MEKPITSLVVEKGRADIVKHESGAISMGADGVALYRLLTIKMGLELEMKGIRITRKAPACFKIIADEFEIKAKRTPEGKRAAYLKFCAMHGLTPKLPPEKTADVKSPAP